MLRNTGRLAIIQSASSLLFNRQPRAISFRRKLLTSHRIEEIINLSALRFKVFKRKHRTIRASVSPACIVVLAPGVPAVDERISYVSPKKAEEVLDDFQIVVEPHDRRYLTVHEASSDSVVWSALMWGGNRDLVLLGRLRGHPTLANPGLGYEVKSREGIIFGDRKKSQPQLRGRRILEAKQFPATSLLHVDVDTLPRLERVETDSRASTDFSAFEWPQLIIKQSWQKGASRFQARLTQSSGREGAVCTQSYVTVHTSAPQSSLLESACLVFNSIFATYYLLLTSGRFATYRPEPLTEELTAVPLPRARRGLLDDINSVRDIDMRVFEAFGFRDAEQVLIEDLFNVTLPDFQGDRSSPGRQRTAREKNSTSEPQLTAYCEYFIRVLKAGFGRDKTVTAIIFQEDEKDSPLPYRLVAFELGGMMSQDIRVNRIKLPELFTELERLGGSHRGRGQIYRQRVARVYESPRGNPTVFVIKPDLCRYWTRSAGLGDADEVALDLFRWYQAAIQSEIAS